MDNTLTWPPHDTDYIPTGAYSATYKGPYDNDYDWPDDTQVFTIHVLDLNLLGYGLRCGDHIAGVRGREKNEHE